MTLEGIDSVDDFVEKLDRIEPPGQLVSLLADPLLQKYVDLNPSRISTARIGVWLAACLEEQFEAHRQGAGDDGYLDEILSGLLRYAQYTKVRAFIISTRAKLTNRRRYTLVYWLSSESICHYGMNRTTLTRF